MTPIAFTLVGLALGGLITWALTRPALAQRRALSDALEARTADVAAATAEAAGARERLAAADARVAVLEEKLPETVKAISTQTLEASRTAFLDQAGERVEKTLLPVQERLTDLQRLVDVTEARRREDGGRLTEQINVLTTGTHALASALGSTQRRGRWGEVQLERILDLAGMRDGLDYTRQTTREGVRPDVVVHLPGDKNVVIDAKAPFDAFEQASAAETEEARITAMNEFARRVRAHVTELGRKGYWAHVTPSPDFTFMFMPTDAHLAAADAHDPDLFTYAHDRGVYLATPRTVIVLLRTVKVAWQNENATNNAKEVLDVASEIHERLARFAEHLGKVGRGLESAVKAYNGAVGSFDARVSVSARRLETLAQTRRELEDLSPVTELAVTPAALGPGEQVTLEILPADAA